MLETIINYFLLFIIYSFIGWVMEVIVKLVEKHRFINRGFLIGPICPIYGRGALLIILLLVPYKSKPVLLFLMAIIICSILEYFTSYIMEVIFKTRWWDYSDDKFNINGRISLNTMLPFGILGVIVTYVINPFFLNILSSIPFNILKIVALIILIIYLIDNILSFDIIFKLRNTISNIEKDSTEEISKKVKAIFLKKGGLYKRLVNAFPNMLSPKERLIAIKNRINKELEIIDKKFKSNKSK